MSITRPMMRHEPGGGMPGEANAGRAGRRRPALFLLLALLTAPLVAVAWSSTGGAPWHETVRAFSSVEALREYVLGFGAWAPVAFILAHAAQVVVAPVPGGVTTVVGPLLFGPWAGTALILAGGLAGSVVLFALVRRWGTPLAARLLGRANFERFSGAFADDRGVLLFFVMLVPLVPDDVAVAAAGLSAVSFRRFVVLVVLGRLPGWAATAFVAADLVGRSTGTLVVAGLAVVVAAVLLLPYRARLESWLLRSTGAAAGGPREVRPCRRQPRGRADKVGTKAFGRYPRANGRQNCRKP